MSHVSPLSSLQRIVRGLFSFLMRGWMLTAITVVVCAYFAAKTASSLVEADVLISTAHASTPVAVRAKKPAAPPKLDPNIISERNIFCSACVPEKLTSNSGIYTGEPAILIALTVADSGARATIRVLGSEVQGSWGLDERIPGVGKLTRIGGVSIDVADDNHNTKTISLLDQAPTAGGSGAATPDAHTPKKPAAENPFEGRIKKLSDGSYEVDRSVVRELVASAGAGAGATASPIVEKGEVKGLRLRGVRPSSAAGQIGLRSGDTIASIDGDAIKTMEQMLELYGKLDKLGGIELQGTRAGKPLSVQLRFK